MPPLIGIRIKPRCRFVITNRCGQDYIKIQRIGLTRARLCSWISIDVRRSRRHSAGATTVTLEPPRCMEAPLRAAIKHDDTAAGASLATRLSFGNNELNGITMVLGR